jgi:hypothetical protein
VHDALAFVDRLVLALEVAQHHAQRERLGDRHDVARQVERLVDRGEAPTRQAHATVLGRLAEVLGDDPHRVARLQRRHHELVVDFGRLVLLAVAGLDRRDLEHVALGMLLALALAALQVAHEHAFVRDLLEAAVLEHVGHRRIDHAHDRIVPLARVERLERRVDVERVTLEHVVRRFVSGHGEQASARLAVRRLAADGFAQVLELGLLVSARALDVGALERVEGLGIEAFFQFGPQRVGLVETLQGLQVRRQVRAFARIAERRGGAVARERGLGHAQIGLRVAEFGQRRGADRAVGAAFDVHQRARRLADLVVVLGQLLQHARALRRTGLRVHQREFGRHLEIQARVDRREFERRVGRPGRRARQFFELGDRVLFLVLGREDARERDLHVGAPRIGGDDLLGQFASAAALPRVGQVERERVRAREPRLESVAVGRGVDGGAQARKTARRPRVEGFERAEQHLGVRSARRQCAQVALGRSNRLRGSLRVDLGARLAVIARFDQPLPRPAVGAEHVQRELHARVDVASEQHAVAAVAQHDRHAFVERALGVQVVDVDRRFVVDRVRPRWIGQRAAPRVILRREHVEDQRPDRAVQVEIEPSRPAALDVEFEREHRPTRVRRDFVAGIDGRAGQRPFDALPTHGAAGEAGVLAVEVGLGEQLVARRAVERIAERPERPSERERVGEQLLALPLAQTLARRRRDADHRLHARQHDRRGGGDPRGVEREQPLLDALRVLGRGLLEHAQRELAQRMLRLLLDQVEPTRGQRIVVAVLLERRIDQRARPGFRVGRGRRLRARRREGSDRDRDAEREPPHSNRGLHHF